MADTDPRESNRTLQGQANGESTVRLVVWKAERESNRKGTTARAYMCMKSRCIVINISEPLMIIPINMGVVIPSSSSPMEFL